MTGCTARAFIAVILLLTGCSRDPPTAPARGVPDLAADLPDPDRARYPLDILVRFRGGWSDGAPLDPADEKRQQARFDDLLDRLLSSLPREAVVVHRTTLPAFGVVALTVNREGYESIRTSGLLESVAPDGRSERLLPGSTAAIDAPLAWKRGFEGAGETVVVIDTGAHAPHPFLADKVPSSSCYSKLGDCPCPSSTASTVGCTENQGAIGDVVPGDEVDATGHGTRVAGIASGELAGWGSGVARASRVLPIRVVDTTALEAYDSDIARALYDVLVHRLDQAESIGQIAAVNVSLGRDLYTSASDCEQGLEGWLINLLAELLWTAGVPVFAGAGNEGSSDKICFPACLEAIFAVGFTGDSGFVNSASNSSPLIAFWAPGIGIESSVPPDSFDKDLGSSYASPHVAGAFAILRGRYPTAPAADLIQALKTGGTPVEDTIHGNGVTRPFINVNAALDAVP